MSSNYRSNPVKKKSIMTPMITGIVIGLLMGVLLALGFAVWLNRNATPFVEKAKSVELLPTRPAKPADAPKADVTKEAGDKPRFEFYQTLPGDKDGSKATASKGGNTPKSADIAPKTASKAAGTSPAAAVANPAEGDASKPLTKENYTLQAGAFQSETDAESLKAKIAFAGLEATVRSVNLPDKGTLYRVRLGPYRSLDEVNRIKAALSQNGIAAAIVKAE